MKTFLRLIGVFFRVSILNEVAYRANFVMQMIQSLFGLLTALLLVQSVFSYTSTLAGWDEAQLLILIGIYLLMGGLMNLVLQPSMQRFMNDVREGKLDHTLLKPADAQLLVSIQQVEIWKLVDVLLGLTLIVAALIWRGGAGIALWEVLGFALALAAGAAIIYSFIFLLCTLSFWYTKVENTLIIFQSMYEAGRWPVTIYPGWLRTTLTFIVPIAFAITIPAQALTHQLTWARLLLAIVLALALLLASRWFWKLGIRHYTGASA